MTDQEENSGEGASGPLAGLRIIEIQGLGPAPFAAMLLADMGADVLRIARPGDAGFIPPDHDLLNRGRPSLELDLKSATGTQAVRDLAANADGLIEGMRPGVMERLGLGPEDLLRANPALIYGRMTGWGQDGPLAARAGHDIDYIALTGMLHAIGADAPEIPLNLLGDFGGGAMYLAFGMLCALHHARRTGQGQVVDAAIVDGVAHLGTMIYAMRRAGMWQDQRKSNLLDGAAPFYHIYRCACGGHVAVGALEPKFWRELLDVLKLRDMPDQMSRPDWAAMTDRLAEVFASQSRDHWAEVFAGSDACVAPVLSLDEAPGHPHMAARGIFGDHGPESAPRFSATPTRAGPISAEPASIGEILQRWRRAPG